MTPTTPPRVVLHVGTPKSGTTFVQRALWHHREELQDRGVTCPGVHWRDMFHAAIEVRERFATWGLDPDEHTGDWAKLCAESRAWPGLSIMSHEILAAATSEQIDRAWQELEGVDVHVVLTVRDLGRQVLSEWQERIKNGSSGSFESFARGAMRQIRRGDFTGPLWDYHDIAAILQRWGAHIPAAHVHVVVAPGPDEAAAELWWRFGEACGFDARALDPTESGVGANQTLGQTQIALLRRVNEALDGRVKQPHYSQVVKRQFAQRVLAAQESRRVQSPPALAEELRVVSRSWVEAIRTRGYTVHGDLALLVPQIPDGSSPAPDAVDPAELVESATAAIAELLVERARRPPRKRAVPRPPAAPAEPPSLTSRIRGVLGRAARRLRHR